MAPMLSLHADELSMAGPVQVQRVVRVGRFKLRFWNINGLNKSHFSGWHWDLYVYGPYYVYSSIFK